MTDISQQADPASLLKPNRTITGMSAVFLPFEPGGEVDWIGFEKHLDRTISSGLIPAVNMDTGSIQHIDAADRMRVLEITGERRTRFVAGACVVDRQGDDLDTAGYMARMSEIVAHGGIPVLFPSWGLNSLAGDDWLEAVRRITGSIEQFIGFELGPQFVPYGRILDIPTWSGLLELPNCMGAKHSSLDRIPEWRRLMIRDAIRPDFMVLTGNDLAIDMVMYGSDYLLGLSSFAPERFAERDRMWAAGDPAFHGLNDLLQYLGQLVFRPPVPSYKHSAAQFLHLCGTLSCDMVPPGVTPRPESDLPILRDIAERAGLLS